MTEEQIKQAAEEYADKMEWIRGELEWVATRDDFIAGAEWADDNLKNPWQDAKKELPAEYKNRRSKPVLIRYGIDCVHYDVWIYDYEDCCWENLSLHPMTSPDDWMPIPELPKINEK